MKGHFTNIFRKSPLGARIKVSKRVSTIILCFLIAAVGWMLIALSDDYDTSISFPVVYNNLPGQKVVVNDLPSTILLNVKASGFKILGYNFRKAQEPVQIDVDSRIGKSISQSEEVLIIPTNTFLVDFNEQLGNNVRINNFFPDSIVFNFSYKSLKRVPVKADFKISFDKQYDSIGSPELFPDSISISGPASMVSKTDFIYTVPLTFEMIKEPVDQKVKLAFNKLLTVSDTIVDLKMNVEKFTEENIIIPVTAVHVPGGYLLKTFPDKIKVRYQVALSKYNLVSAPQFGAIVDANKMDDKQSNKLNVELIAKPSFVKSVVIEPARVDYILRKQ